MDIHSLISQYGYAALLIGSLAEGETITLLGGVAAHQGLLKFPFVVLCVALGGMLGDQVLYLVGRHYGTRVLYRFRKHRKHISRARKIIINHPYLFVIGSRFMYGFRVIGPVLIGISRLPPRIFFPLNILGAAIWATLFTTLGYLGGEMVMPLLHQFNSQIKHLIWPAMLLVVVALVIWRFWWQKRRHKRAKK
ncbi:MULTISPECIES: DedA family protein [Mangrovibacter]|uniref:Membrane protein DedA with SNARE-associated domain n=1 Tax=Mangrovibacter plantisponsor TaxID=451513 RepID=A0A317Q6Q7_9ENTR|nr:MULTISPECIES: DedA family protein [Mangrovibacter]KEA50466.1 membrane protein [Mangrovibacter sp. MFB070]PWW11420.1 membrane protein DedA with SNARE-associated domain [Mangrovibacter plantisponsor]